MICVQNEKGRVVRLIENVDSEVVYSQVHGFVSADALARRQELRKAGGYRQEDLTPRFQFRLDRTRQPWVWQTKGEVSISPLRDLSWALESEQGKFTLGWLEVDKIVPLTEVELCKGSASEGQRSWVWLILIAFLFIGGALLWQVDRKVEAVAEVEAPPKVEPVVVKPIAAAKPIPKAVPEEKTHQALDPKAKAQKALTQTLGFLKLVGQKNLKKAIGGLPTPVAEASPGAGPGGKEGSGGQLLAGLGQGLRKTTVGNSGMVGLGGIGTKGAGGGLGGYGETNYGSGAGHAVSAVPMGQDAVIESGLDRSLIIATINRYLNQVRACYEEGLKRKADMLGQVTYNFEINGSGRLNFSRVQRSTLGDRQVESCIADRMMGWKFPEPRGKGTVKVSYPFMLRPVKS